MKAIASLTAEIAESAENDLLRGLGVLGGQTGSPVPSYNDAKHEERGSSLRFTERCPRRARDTGWLRHVGESALQLALDDLSGLVHRSPLLFQFPHAQLHGTQVVSVLADRGRVHETAVAGDDDLRFHCLDSIERGKPRANAGV